VFRRVSGFEEISVAREMRQNTRVRWAERSSGVMVNTTSQIASAETGNWLFDRTRRKTSVAGANEGTVFV